MDHSVKDSPGSTAHSMMEYYNPIKLVFGTLCATLCTPLCSLCVPLRFSHPLCTPPCLSVPPTHLSPCTFCIPLPPHFPSGPSILIHSPLPPVRSMSLSLLCTSGSPSHPPCAPPCYSALAPHLPCPVCATSVPFHAPYVLIHTLWAPPCLYASLRALLYPLCTLMLSVSYLNHFCTPPPCPSMSYLSILIGQGSPSQLDYWGLVS